MKTRVELSIPEDSLELLKKHAKIECRDWRELLGELCENGIYHRLNGLNQDTGEYVD